MDVRLVDQGFSLIEVMVAVALLLFALVGPLSIVTKSIESGLFTQHQAVAQYLAQEGIEAFTAARNDHEIKYLHNPNQTFDWSWIPSQCKSPNTCNLAFTTTSNNQNQGDPMTTAKNCGSSNCVMYYDSTQPRDQYVPGFISTGGVKTPFTRTITVTDLKNASNAIIGKYVTSTVTWDTRIFGTPGDSQSVTLYAALYQLY